MLDDSKLTLDSYVEDAYLQYALAVVKGRALAQVEDGLKPVQRRILYAMQQLGLRSTAKAVKSARVVGDVLGKYHPHGDQSVYDALVRMAQPFTLRYPLIEGQGNFGSLDGDTAAAMRYTEAKLSPFAELLLTELGQGTVDYGANYDGTLQEPELSPSRLPMLLLNGTMGIAVGMAADVPPHNLREVALACVRVVADPQASLDDVLGHILGPDFPGGGQLVSSPAEVRSVYSSGRGSLRCRARWVKEELARGQWQIVVTELPYQVSTKKILEQIDTLTNPQPPAGKKAITQQQANLKLVGLDFLEKVVDESDKDHSIRLVIVPRNSKVDADAMMAFLLANTSLEDTVSLNMTLIGRDGKPSTKGLLTVLQEWAQFRLVTVRRRTEHELDGVNKRIHILEGRLTVFLNLEQVIRTIREAEDPKVELMSQFALSDVQADDILEMRLRQLNKLEGFKLEKELDELRAEQVRLTKLLSSEKAMRELITKEVQADAAKFGDDRRTVIKPELRVQQASVVRSVVEEDLTVVVTRNLWVKAYKGKGLSEDAFTLKPGDAVAFKVETSTVHSVVLLDTLGRAYSFAASAVPTGRGDGSPLSTFVEIQPEAKPFAFMAGTGDEWVVFSGQRGYGFKAQLKNLVARQRSGKAFLVLEPEEAPLPPVVLPQGQPYLGCGSSEGKLLAFAADEVKALPNGGKGVMLMALDEPYRVSALVLASETGLQASCQAAGAGKAVSLDLKGDEWLKYVGRRARKGAFLPKKAVLVAAAPKEAV